MNTNDMPAWNYTRVSKSTNHLRLDHLILTGYEVNFIGNHTFEIFTSIEPPEIQDSGDVFMNAVRVCVSSSRLPCCTSKRKSNFLPGSSRKSERT